MSAALAGHRPRRLVVPATRAEPRETLVCERPFFLRAASAAHLAEPPPLLSFDGDRFFEDFLTGAADRARLPRLLPWRDWSEPPTAMLDAAGLPLYGASRIKRGLPDAIEADTGADIDADGVPKGAPAWLRKLYLPLHLRFTFVAFDVVCHRAGWPRLTRKRVKAAGVVVRRLVRDPAHERWEDWISVDGARGLWFELAGKLAGGLGGELPADPAAIPTSAWRGLDAVLRARLALPAGAPMPNALESARLAVLPITVAGAAEHCTVYGLMPVFSAAEHVTDDDPSLSAADAAKALHDAALADLTTAWADDAGLRARLLPALRDLLAITLLPARPTPPEAANARAMIVSGANLNDPFHPVGGSDVDARVPELVQGALGRARAALTPGADDTTPPPDAAGFWTASGASEASKALAGGTAGMVHTFSMTGAWDTLARDRLHSVADAMLAPGGTALADPAQRAVAQGMMAVTLLRLRRFRLALIARLHQQAFGSTDEASLEAVRPIVIAGVVYNMPAATAGGLGLEIEAILGVDAVRTPPGAAPPWPPLDLAVGGSLRARDAHRAALALEAAYAPFDAAGAAGGSAFETILGETARNTVAPALAGIFKLPDDPTNRLHEAGLDLFEQPARGLLLFPGPAPLPAAFMAMRDAVANRYLTSAPAAAAEARGRGKVRRLRFDHYNLYAAWCWVRVAGRDPCEKDIVIWTNRTEPFSIAEPTDLLGAKPVTIQLPDIPKLVRDLPRMAKARARPFAAFNTPANSGFSVGDDPKDTKREWGIAWICSFGIPVITICAYILFSIIFSILIILPGFAWMLLLKFCVPVPWPKKS